METIEKNKLIAEFMGYAIIDSHGNHKDDNYKYHSSWDWLMMVVQKIESLGFDVNIKGISCSVNKLCETNTLVNWVLGDRTKKIDLVYITVVEFIEWYNKNK